MILLPCLFALGVTLCLEPLFMKFSFVVGAVDLPDGRRKRHAAPTARLGGLGFYLVFAIFAAFTPGIASPLVSALLSGGGLLVACGAADDALRLSPLPKLFFQATAAVSAVWICGVPDTLSVGPAIWHLPPWAVFLLSVLFLTVTINAANFSDGTDGLCGTLHLLTFLAVAYAGSLWGTGDLVAVLLLLSAVLLGFLPYNRAPALLFMGDGGSQFLGLAAGLSLLSLPKDGFSLFSLLFYAVPLADFCFSVFRRLRHGKNPLSADRGHLHHRLLDRGFSPTAVTAVLSAFALSGILTALGLFRA